MSEGSPWVTTVVVVVTALLVSILVIAGLAYWGGQDWLLPRSLARSPAPAVQAFAGDEEFGLTEYVDRTLVLDELGTLTIGGVSYDDVGLRSYLQNLTEAGGVHVTLQVDSDGTTERRLTVERICADVTGLPPNIIYVNDATTGLALENDLSAP
jgi:hypothetical protein